MKSRVGVLLEFRSGGPSRVGGGSRKAIRRKTVLAMV